MNGAVEILKLAMSMERQGQRFYEGFADQVESPVVKALFHSLAKTEEEHYNILKNELDKLAAGGQWSPVGELKPSIERSLFDIRLEAEKLTTEKLAMSHSDISLLRMAYLIENDFAEYYQKAMNYTEDENGKKILEMLYNWENEHRRVFYEEYKRAMDDYWFDQSFSPF